MLISWVSATFTVAVDSVTFLLSALGIRHMSRVLTAWSISTRVAQPLLIVAGGLLAWVTSARAAIAVPAGLVLTSVILLPWRAADPVPAGPGRWRAARPG